MHRPLELADLDRIRARADKEFCAASAEWLAAWEAYSAHQQHERSLKIYQMSTEIIRTKQILLDRGHAEYAPQIAADTQKFDEMRADDLLALTLAPNALTKLTNNLQRAEYACVAMRRENGVWPDRMELQREMTCRFKWRSAEATLLRAVNESDPSTCGLWFAPEGWLADAMQFPELDRRTSYPTCFVSAEAQQRHRLHRIYERWAYRSVFEEDPA